jgi:hypothetical protein
VRANLCLTRPATSSLGLFIFVSPFRRTPIATEVFVFIYGDNLHIYTQKKSPARATDVYRPRIRGHRVDGNWAECAREADLGDTEIAPPLLKIDPGASTALAPVGTPAELVHAARSRRRARTCAGV